MGRVDAVALATAMARDGFVIERLDQTDDPSIGEGFWYRIDRQTDCENGNTFYRAYLEFEMDGSNYTYVRRDLDRLRDDCLKHGYARSRYLADCELREAQR